MSLCIFVEGGGDQRKTTSACRAGFEALFNKIVLPRQSPRIIICGSRQSAYDDFCNELKVSLRSCDGCILLVDSEAPVITAKVWEHLETRKGDSWVRPATATEDHVYLMVQSMESWFLADREALKEFYGQDFKVNALPGQPNIELISKQDVFEALKAATSSTKKRKYHKTKHGFAILALLDPKKVSRASRHANRLFKFLNEEFSC